MNNIIDYFLRVDNISHLARELGIDEHLVKKFAKRWYALAEYQDDLLTRRMPSTADREVAYLNNKFIDEFSRLTTRTQTWEENQLKEKLFAHWKDQKPNRAPATFYGDGRINPSRVVKRYNQFMGETYDSQYTEYDNLLYKEKEKTKSKYELARQKKIKFADPKEIYERCKNKRY